MVTAIFPAAGQGKRMGAGKNKVLLMLQGKLILVRTLLAFSKNKLVDDLIVVVAKEEVEEVSALLKQVHGLKPWQVIAGGAERQYSIANGLAALAAASHIVLVHDAARPLVSGKVIAAIIEEARKSGAAIAAVPEKNTIKIVDDAHAVIATPERKTLWSIQTPQGFRREVILNAYAQAATEGFLGTDDASLVERLGIKVKVVESDYQNIKITTPEDMLVAEAFLSKNKKEYGRC